MDECREDGQVGRHVGCIDLGRFWLNDQTERRWLVVSQASSSSLPKEIWPLSSDLILSIKTFSISAFNTPHQSPSFALWEAMKP